MEKKCIKLKILDAYQNIYNQYIATAISEAIQMMSGFLRHIVMKTLANKKLSGYDLTKEIEKSTGTWKPSFGSIYPLMDKLLKEKLVDIEVQGRRKLYFLTTEGKKHLGIIDKSKNFLVDRLVTTWKAFGRITDKREVNFMMEVFNSLKKGQLPFKEFNPELNEFRATIFELYSTGKDRKKIKSILRGTIKKLRAVK
ncbi:PadR family transcriptional regulator [Candidatus Pacearchaeota archaeon]|nr:PadR family transcriptional regulator [Candidatus Pacearchaeota archaeon]